ncbi:bifunctional 3-(3-hydroxy-phenyl)propionate/3-hydroxycinnamic acid hydroxylase [Novosphingobium sp.]|uniref:bifunctional 3-(3-hydroxy-phenyl)propionate/3-hydroxycinnamic acid hydroxylase MhpA n=1 Tax=Novosphingobium sp. TaxID=1874826 RepID=UPI0025F87234|nr:bifunctional 3-(3-hydroxy-phenyl)propionate/3-hydroxycinnamic acid hydroxylase [Novosphingobium sp.]MCC6926812.1 bifunctional 3-(3-hydroxy-phenyl)propionate/3-hydroxycinnamic acid hydroxylase [Novosphingobium sp.]
MAYDCDVLIVGGGPAGVTLAVLLAQQGTSVLVAEKEAAIYPLPRAAHLDHEVMRILQEAGVADEVARTSRTTARYDFLTADRQVLLRFEGSDQIGPGGWPGANMIHQPSVEQALRAQLAALPKARLECRWEMTGFVEDADGVTATLATPAGERQLRARYLVGADGARSPVRTASQIAFEDLGFEEPWLVVDALVDDYSKLPDINLQICDPARPTTCVLMGEGRHRWEFMILPGESAEQVSQDVFVEKLLEPWGVKDAVRLERKAVYTFQARIAQQWRKGRVLLAGDAAHQTPPFAGQGMCSGLRDVHNLAWKLTAVLRGADDTLLDTYQTERGPNLRATIDMAVMMGRTVCITDPAAAAMRNEQMLAARAAGHSPDGNVSYPPIGEGAVLPGTPAAGSYFPQPVAADGTRLDTVLGSGHWLLARSDLDRADLAPFRDQLEGWFAKTGVEAVLVRPDRQVFGSGDPDSLKAAWAALVGA